ncbi:pur operon repressor [Longirhabdus pacifica]|uniref:pur operon repressor n=1 Tax=Longirhabdus pacifica TaxID=2305227 RepID=UPI001008C700|nr:pur operon repressor [Longirhabdus pacifica]
MKKLKRSYRLVDMTQFLLASPHTLIPLTTFSERYQSAKSSISEDLAIIKEVLSMEGLGDLQTLAGATGGVIYIPQRSKQESKVIVDEICLELSQPERILPGGYLYMSDILGNPHVLRELGKTFATAFSHLSNIDYILTVETKGIPLAYATSSYLNVPVIVARRDHNVTEGSAVSINYVAGSSKRIQTMSLARRALQEQSKVIIIDDFMKAGGTVRGMIDLMNEFKAQVVGVGVFVEAREEDGKYPLVEEYTSLARLVEVNTQERRVKVYSGNYFEEGEE